MIHTKNRISILQPAIVQKVCCVLTGLMLCACLESSSEKPHVVDLNATDEVNTDVSDNAPLLTTNPINTAATDNTANTATESPHMEETHDTEENTNNQAQDSPHSTGTLCVAPLDQCPPKMRFPHGPRKAITVEINGITKTVTDKEGARISGLPYGKHLLTLTEQGSKRPYFRKKIDVGREPECVYDNASYGTIQISDKPRRRFCRKCFAATAD